MRIIWSNLENRKVNTFVEELGFCFPKKENIKYKYITYRNKYVLDD